MNETKTRPELVCPRTGKPPGLPPLREAWLDDPTARCWICGKLLVIGEVEVEVEREEE